MLQGACQLASPARPVEAAVAPFWHTRALIVMLLAVATTATALDAHPGAATATVPPAGIVGSYGPLLLVNLGLAFYVARFGLERSMLGRLVGRVEVRRLAHDVAWAIALMTLVLSTEAALQLGVGMPESVFARALLPRAPWEKAAWALLAIVIGTSEELLYRGYLRQQLQALSGSAWLGIMLQALLFGIAHGSQGQWAVARFAAYGVALGYVAWRRRSIVACMLGHVGLDLYAGLGG